MRLREQMNRSWGKNSGAPVPKNMCGNECESKDVRNQGALLCLISLTLCDPMDYSLPGSSVHGASPGNNTGVGKNKNTGVGCHALLQGIFPTQGLNSGLPHCRRILYHLSHQGSPRILEWVAYPFSRGSSRPRNWTGVSWIRRSLYQLSYQRSPRPR